MSDRGRENIERGHLAVGTNDVRELRPGLNARRNAEPGGHCGLNKDVQVGDSRGCTRKVADLGVEIVGGPRRVHQKGDDRIGGSGSRFEVRLERILSTVEAFNEEKEQRGVRKRSQGELGLSGVRRDTLTLFPAGVHASGAKRAARSLKLG